MVGDGESIQNPVHVAVNNGDVGILVELQEGRQGADAILDRAIEQDLGLRRQLRTDQQVDVAEADRKGQATKPRGQGDARVALPLGVLVSLGERVVQLCLLGVGQHVIGGVATKVNPRLRHRRHAGGWNIVKGQYGIALAGRLIGTGRDHAIAVGVLQLEVDPVLRRHLIWIELPRGEQELEILVAELIPVDRDLVVIELVVGAEALDVFQGRRQGQLGIPEPGVLNRLRIARDHGRGQRVLRGEGMVRDAG